ncbi:MAG: hypothetical protein KDB01_06500 [Planctomycetaceae bacterium]|nr:hypothetical protein [Planctomycetaceae bacterium]
MPMHDWTRVSAGTYHAFHNAWIEPLCVGTALSSMPLFLTTTHYIPLPLEETYTQSWVGVPERWKRVIVPDV